MSAAPGITSDDYRRQARQLRARHAGDSATLITSLRDLAVTHDRFATKQTTVEIVDRTPAPFSSASLVEQFGIAIRERLQGEFISYSDRLDLLAGASRLGIGRFEANLMIAAVQHAAQNNSRVDADTSDPSTSRVNSARSMLLLAGVLQAIIAVVAYRLLVA